MVSYAIGVVVLAAVLLVIGALTKKSKPRKQLQMLAFVVGVVGILGIAGVVPYLDGEIPLGGLGGGTLTTTTTTTVTGGACSVEDTTVSLSGINKYTTVATGGYHKYKINGGAPLTVADTGTFTASPGDVLDILWMNESSSSDYFSDIQTITIPCKGTFPLTKELYSNGTLSLEVFNEEGNIIPTGNDAENETLGYGDYVQLTFNIKGQNENALPYGGIAVVEYNTTETKKAELQIGGTKTTVPACHPDMAGYDQAAFTVPAMFGSEVLRGILIIDADNSGSVDPLPDGVVNVTIYSNNYFANEDNGGAYELGVCDEEDTRIIDYIAVQNVWID